MSVGHLTVEPVTYMDGLQKKNILYTHGPMDLYQDYYGTTYLPNYEMRIEKPLETCEVERQSPTLDNNHNVIVINGEGTTATLDTDYPGVPTSERPFSQTGSLETKHGLKRQWTQAFESNDDVPSDSQPKQSGSEYETMFEMVAKTIMNCKGGEIILGDIYSHIMDHYPKYKDTTKTNWRITVRHCLSVNPCFIKGPRAKNGRGCLWKIHPACLDYFATDEFDKKRAAKFVQQYGTNAVLKGESNDQSCERDDSKNGYPRAVSRSGSVVGCLPVDGGQAFLKEGQSHIRHYVPMTTIPLTSYTYYELLINLCDRREQH